MLIGRGLPINPHEPTILVNRYLVRLGNPPTATTVHIFVRFFFGEKLNKW